MLRKRDIDGVYDRTIYGWMYRDAVEDEFQNTDVDSIPVNLLKVSFESDNIERPVGLDLRSRDDNVYSRLGTFEFLNGDLERSWDNVDSDENNRMHLQEQMDLA